MAVRGDLSSLTWVEGDLDPYTTQPGDNEEMVHIYYSSLNFRDVMHATGKLTIDVVQTHRLKQDCVLGFEFSARTFTGRRVMGMSSCKSIANIALCDKALIWDVPDEWTLEEAATVPVVYGTVLFSLVMKGCMKKGESILIHSGSGGVGQAAINVALHYGLNVFTTVGTQEKKDFLMKQFPQLKEQNIGNSRDTSFEKMIICETKGRGVDLVLNSLAGEKLQASVRCLAKYGRFLEIGKFDMANNSQLGMEMFLKQTSFHGIILDKVLEGSVDAKMELREVLDKALKDGVVKPLVRTVFKVDEVEQAYRYMASGKHMGKVLIQIRPDEEKKKNVIPTLRTMMARPRFYCDPKCTYMVIGGLGGFGLELADWMVLRGARKLILTSRKGVSTGYQSVRIRIWRSYGAAVHISTADVTTREGVQRLLTESKTIGPVKGIFNLAVVLHDGLFENQTEEKFIASAKCKAVATCHLDELSREQCPELEHFVVFSSVSCGRGNAGQSNYGMSNSVMERVCEARVRDGLPGLAVQWGAIGDVGLVAEMLEENLDIVIGGTLQQKMISCLETLDGFLKQPHPIVASMVVAEKHSGAGGATNIVDCVTNILGLRDIKTVSPVATLPELGMDSMMAVEIQQALEREFEVSLTAQDIRTLTFARLQELDTSTGPQSPQQPKTLSDESSSEVVLNESGLQYLMHSIGDEITSAHPIVQLPSLVDCSSSILFMFPGVDGLASTLQPLASNITSQTQCLQLGYENPAETIQDMTTGLLPYIKNQLRPGATFNILGYSFGAMLALETAAALEADGYEGHVILVDGAPDFLKELVLRTLGSTDDSRQVNLILNVLKLVAPHESSNIAKLRPAIERQMSWGDRCSLVLKHVKADLEHSQQHQIAVMNAVYKRTASIIEYQWQHELKLTSPITLLYPTQSVLTMDEDYGLSKLSHQKVEVIEIEGNHTSILGNKKTADAINEIINDGKIGEPSVK